MIQHVSKAVANHDSGYTGDVLLINLLYIGGIMHFMHVCPGVACQPLAPSGSSSLRFLDMPQFCNEIKGKAT